MLLAVACSVAWQPTAPVHRALAPARASAPRLAVDTGVGKDASLEAEFESVKAASKVAADLAPSLEEMTTPARGRKRDAIYGAWRRAKSLVGLKKELDAAAAELTADECEIDEPEVCEEATGAVRGLIARTFGFGRDKSDAADDTEGDAGDSMEEGWQKRGTARRCRGRSRCGSSSARAASRCSRRGRRRAPTPTSPPPRPPPPSSSATASSASARPSSSLGR